MPYQQLFNTSNIIFNTLCKSYRENNPRRKSAGDSGIRYYMYIFGSRCPAQTFFSAAEATAFIGAGM